MDHDGLDDLLDGPIEFLTEREVEDLLGPQDPKILEPEKVPYLEYVPTPIQARNDLSLDSGITFSEFEETDGRLAEGTVFDLRADLRNLPDRSAPLPPCLRFQGRCYSDPLRIGLAFRVARAVGVLREEDFLDPIPDLRARARAGEAKRRKADAARRHQRSRDRPPRADLRKTIEAKATRVAIPAAASTPTPSPDHSLLERTAVEMFQCARSARMEITTLRKEAEELRGERRALRDEIRGLRDFMKTKGIEPPPWGPSFSMPPVSSLRGKLSQQI